MADEGRKGEMKLDRRSFLKILGIGGGVTGGLLAGVLPVKEKIDPQKEPLRAYLEDIPDNQMIGADLEDGVMYPYIRPSEVVPGDVLHCVNTKENLMVTENDGGVVRVVRGYGGTPSVPTRNGMFYKL